MIKQSQDSVASFAFQWTERRVYETLGTFYRRYFTDMGIWHDRHDGNVVADVGSGNGRHVFALARLTRARKIISVELAEASVAHQRRTLTDPRIEILQGDAADVAFDADFIYLAGVIQHTARPQAVLDRCMQNLRDGGELVVSFYMVTPTTQALRPVRWLTSRLPKPVLWWISPLLAPIFMVRKAGRAGGIRNARHTAYDYFGSHHYQAYFTLAQIEAMFDRAGVHPRNVLRLGKGLYRVRKGGFRPELTDEVFVFGGGPE